jgi:hypothetical protein
MTIITSKKRWFFARPLWTDEEVKREVRFWGKNAIKIYGETVHLYGCFDTEQDARYACRVKEGSVVFFIDIPIPKEVNDHIKDRCEKILADWEDSHNRAVRERLDDTSRS